MVLLGMRVAVIHVGMRADGDEHSGAILGEDDVAGPVAAAAQPAAAGNAGQSFRCAASLQIAILVLESHDGIGVPNVDPTRIGAEGIKRNPEGLGQPGGEDLGLPRFAVTGHAAKDEDLAALAVGEKEIPVGRGSQQAGIPRSAAYSSTLNPAGA